MVPDCVVSNDRLATFRVFSDSRAAYTRVVLNGGTVRFSVESSAVAGHT